MKVKRDRKNKNKYTLMSVKGDASVKYIDKNMLLSSGFTREGIKTEVYVNNFDMWIHEIPCESFDIYISSILIGTLQYTLRTSSKAILTFKYEKPQEMHDYILKELENVFSQNTQREQNQKILNNKFNITQ